MPRLFIAVILAFSVSSVACTDNCDALVDQVCSRLGEQHDACQRARKRNETATSDDKRMCGEALALTQRLTPKN
jgi:hypothetical protein